MQDNETLEVGQEMVTTEVVENVDVQEDTTKEVVKMFTQDEVNKMVQDRLDRERKAVDEKEAEAKKLARMNQVEKSQYEVEKLQAHIKELEATATRNALKTTVNQLLSEEGLHVNDSLIEMLTQDNAELTNNIVKEYVNSVNEQANKLMREQLKGNQPKVGGVVSRNSQTVEEIRAIKDPVTRQAAMRENANLFV